MDDHPATAQEAVSRKTLRFEAILTPHRSLGPRGFAILMACVAGISFAAGIAFASLGAWPVGGFFGLDWLALYVAFRMSFRAGRLTEIVRLTTDELTILRLHPGGRREHFSLNPYWTRVWLDETGPRQSDLRVGFHNREVSIGRFLGEDERLHLAAALREALAENRSGGAA